MNRRSLPRVSRGGGEFSGEMTQDFDFPTFESRSFKLAAAVCR